MKRAIVRLVVCAAVGAVTSAPAWLMPRRYVSRATLRLVVYWPRSAGHEFVLDAPRHWRQISSIAFDPGHLTELADRLDRPLRLLGYPAISLRQKVTARATYSFRGRRRALDFEYYCCFDLEANSDSPQKAQLIERELIVRLLETLTYYKSNMSPHIDCPPLGVCADTGFELLDPASLPERPTPDPVAFATLGSLLGLIAGIVWESGRRR